MTKPEIVDMQRRIDEGILLAHQRMVARYRKENWTLTVFRSGSLCELPATDFNF